MEGSLDLEVGYYNEKLAVWEPLIEPVVRGEKMRRWQLNLEVSVRSGSLSDMPLEQRKLNMNTSEELRHQSRVIVRHASGTAEAKHEHK